MGLGLRPGAKAPDQPPMPYRLRASPRLYPASIEPPFLPIDRAANDVCRSLYWRSTAQTPHGASIGG